MALITIPFVFSVGNTIISSQHNSNFNTIANDYNGNIIDANIASNAAIAYVKLVLSNSIKITDLSATGTPSSTTFLRGDNSWAVIPFNSPILAAHCASTQSIPQTTFTQRTSFTVDLDSGSYFSSDTYTPLIAGWYHVTYMDAIVNPGGNSERLAVYKNGSLYATAESPISSASPSNTSMIVDTFIQMNGSTDNLKFYIYNASGGGNQNALGQGYCFVSIRRVF